MHTSHPQSSHTSTGLNIHLKSTIPHVELRFHIAASAELATPATMTTHIMEQRPYFQLKKILIRKVCKRLKKEVLEEAD